MKGEQARLTTLLHETFAVILISRVFLGKIAFCGIERKLWISWLFNFAVQRKK